MLPWSAPSELRKYTSITSASASAKGSSGDSDKMTAEIPALPEPAHPHLDSMLSRKFGKEVANYFSGKLL